MSVGMALVDRREGDEAVGELALLLRLAQAVNRASVLEQVYPPALEAVMSGLGVNRASILLMDDAGSMRFRAWRGLSDTYRQAVDGHSPWKPGDHSPAPILVEDVEQDPAMAPYRPVFRAEGIRALAFIPLVETDVLLGKFMVYADGPRRFTEDEVRLAQAIASQVAQGVARAQLYERERRLRARAEQSAERTQRLARVTAELSNALREDEVAEVVIREGVRELGASTAGLWRVDSDRRQLVMLRTHNYPQGSMEQVRRVPLDADLPVAESVRTGAPVWLQTWDAYRARFTGPEAQVQRQTQGEVAIACLPLVVEGRALGGLAFTFSDARPFHEEERAFIQVVCHHCALAMERARLYVAGEVARERASFLAEAGAMLSSSLDYQQTLKRVARLAVPGIADWVAVEVSADGDRPAESLVEHADSRKVELGLEYRRKYPPDPQSPVGVPAVIRTGQSELHAEISEADLERAARDPEHLRLMRQLDIRSAMVVPIQVRGRVFGAITFVSSQPGRYTAQDVEMAEQLGRRAGVAIENAALYQEAVKAVGLRDDFLSIAGHELKTPLTALMFQAQSLQRLSGSPEKVRERAEKVLQNGQRLAKLIEELLDVSRITSGRFKLEMEEVQLASMVREVAARLSDDAARAGVEIRLSLDDSVRGTWDRARLEQVATNLLGNSIKYGAGKPVEVKLEAGPPGARLRVIDRGIGIAPEDQARVFERFERAVSSRQFTGLGLGLWIARQIIEAHGGRIAVKSQPGEGAEFTVELPVRPPGESGP